MTPLEMAHKIILFSAQEHARDLRKALMKPSQQPELNVRATTIRQNLLSDPTQIPLACEHIAGMIEELRMPFDPKVRVLPTRYLKLAKSIDGYLQELGFKSMEKPIYDALKAAREKAKTPAF